MLPCFPGKVISEEYILEYGRDCLEMHVGAVDLHDRALVVDDLIATGGTLCAAMKLLGMLLAKCYYLFHFLCKNNHMLRGIYKVFGAETRITVMLRSDL